LRNSIRINEEGGRKIKKKKKEMAKQKDKREKQITIPTPFLAP
jgi:hypothetical protein